MAWEAGWTEVVIPLRAESPGGCTEMRRPEFGLPGAVLSWGFRATQAGPRLDPVVPCGRCGHLSKPLTR